MQTVSVIIPVLNEAILIGGLVRHLLQYGNDSLQEIIVVDGKSQDESIAAAKKAGARVVACQKCGRAHQMNKGAKAAKGDILFFVHVDTLPPASYLEDILKAVREGNEIGCYRAHYQSKNWLLKINSYCTRFKSLWCRGGDQTLFVTRSFFEKLGAYRDDCKIMEEYELIQKAEAQTTFYIIPKEVLVSTRKYDERSYWRVQLASLMAFILYRFNWSDEQIAATYHKLLGGE